MNGAKRYYRNHSEPTSKFLTRENRQSNTPSHGSSDIYRSKEIDISSVVASGDSAPALKFVEGSLNEIALFVEFTIILPLNLAIGLWGYDRDRSLPVNEFSLPVNEFQDIVAVIAPVCSTIVRPKSTMYNPPSSIGFIIISAGFSIVIGIIVLLVCV
jgi:hypothetical protein